MRKLDEVISHVYAQEYEPHPEITLEQALLLVKHVERLQEVCQDLSDVCGEAWKDLGGIWASFGNLYPIRRRLGEASVRYNDIYGKQE